MKYLTVAILMFGFIPSKIQAQQITGHWYSKDGSRHYAIHREGDSFQAVLIHSTRPGDAKGRSTLGEFTYSTQKKRYSGVLYAPDDGLPVAAQVQLADEGGHILRWRLRRLFFMKVTVHWYREPQDADTDKSLPCPSLF